MRKTLFASLLASTRLPMRMAEAPEAGAPADPPSGVTQDGDTTRFTPVEGEEPAKAPGEEAAVERPTEWPEGVNSWEDFGKLTQEERVKAISAANEAEKNGTTITTETTEGTKTGIDLLVQQTLEGTDPEVAAKAEPFVRKFAENGALSDEDVTAAAKATGYSEAIVRQFMLGGETQNAQAVAPVFELVGGADNYPDFQSWANEALGPEDHAKINAALGLSEDGLTVKGVPDAAALKDYAEAYKASGRGPAPRDLTKESRTTDPAPTGSQGYASQQDMTNDMNDPRYRTSPAFRKEVEGRVDASNF